MTTTFDTNNNTESTQENELENQSTGETEAENRPKRSEREKLLHAGNVTSHKDLPTLEALQERLQRLTESLTSADDELKALETLLQTRIAEHHEWQKTLVADFQQTQKSIASLIEEGNVGAAQSQWKHMQAVLRRINEAEQQKLEAELPPLAEAFDKLVEEKRSHASEARNALIEQMSGLKEADLPLAQKASKIRNVQEAWKALGQIDENDPQLQTFRDISQAAFEPCKAFFKERKEKQASNLIARNQICEQLEAYVESRRDQEADLTEVNKLERQAREDWKKYAPVAQKKIKPLQQRFNDALGALRDHRKSALKQHNAAKRELIEKAQSLVQQEDLQAAIREAKQLQQQWKDLGPGSYKDDKTLWADFRGACDALFARRDTTEGGKAARKDGKAPARKNPEISRQLSQLEALLTLDDAAFVDSRSEFQQLSKSLKALLQAEFGNTRNTIKDKFRKLEQSYRARQKASPDKKTLQLQEQASEQSAWLCEQEQAIISQQTQTLDSDAVAEHKTACQAIADNHASQLLLQRLEQLETLASAPDKLRKLQDENAMAAREICVDAEIMLGKESPDSDKAIRMQQQLKQLKKGLGQVLATRADRQAHLQKALLTLECMGPLDGAQRTTLRNRLQALRA
jgi:predicted mannosyl-3-phosphoglycerate phosphatase (HAD superfamily)/ubiquitin